MGFLSRKSRRDDQSPEPAEHAAVETAQQTIEQPPEENGEIKISKGAQAEPPPSPPQPPAPAEHAEQSEAAEQPEAAEPSEPEPAEPAEPARMRAEELITPSRHGSSSAETDAEDAKGAQVFAFANQKG